MGVYSFPTDYEWVNIEINSVFYGIDSTRPYTLRVGEFGVYGSFSATNVEMRDISEHVHVWSGTDRTSFNNIYDRQLSGQLNDSLNWASYSSTSNIKNGTYETVAPPSPYHYLNFSFKFNTRVSYIAQLTTWIAQDAPFGVPAELTVYFGHTRAQAEAKSGAFQSIDLRPLRSELSNNSTLKTLQIAADGTWGVGTATSGPDFDVSI